MRTLPVFILQHIKVLKRERYEVLSIAFKDLLDIKEGYCKVFCFNVVEISKKFLLIDDELPFLKAAVYRIKDC